MTTHDDTRAHKMTKGVKHDQGKSRMDLIPPEVVFAMGGILGYGANKYADRNWEQGIGYGRVFGALMRHLWAWWRGENNDPESGLSHLHHALACLTFLITYDARKMTELDDRPMHDEHGATMHQAD